jgi:hypothetical protein
VFEPPYIGPVLMEFSTTPLQTNKNRKVFEYFDRDLLDRNALAKDAYSGTSELLASLHFDEDSSKNEAYISTRIGGHY